MDLEYSTDNNMSNGEGQQNKADSTEVRLLIENSNVGAIIGKGGCNSKRIREENNVFLSIMKSDFRNVQERVMLVKGELVSVGKAVSMVLGFISDASAQKSGVDQDGASSTAKLLVHRSAVGAIIGKQGATIKQTQADTGCRIQISQEPLPNSTDKTVTISGPKASVDEAILTVLQQLKDNPLRPGVREFQYQPSNQMGGMGGMGMGGLANALGNGYGMQGGMGGMGLGGGMGGNLPGQGASQFGGQGMGGIYGQQQQNALGSSSQYGGMGGMPAMGGAGVATSTQKIAIPTVTAGCVIGKMGSTIKDIRMQSGTSISIADPDSTATGERVVTISGNTQGIQAAIYLIRQLVEHYQPAPAQQQQY